MFISWHRVLGYISAVLITFDIELSDLKSILTQFNQIQRIEI